MASNVVLKFANVEGESTQDGYVGWIEAQSCNFGVSAPINATAGTGLASGAGIPSNYALSTEMGTHSAALLKRMLQGVHHDQVDINCLKLVGENAKKPYFLVEGKHVYVDHISWSAGSDGKLMEMVSFQATEHKWTYHQQKTAGGALDAKTPVIYDVQKGKVAE
jgi:type VI protein secretion system component Hcp